MKLLSRTVQNYVIFSALLLIISTPVFYFSIQRLFVHELDKELISHKSEFYQIIPLLKTESELEFFRLMNDEFILKEGQPISRKDSIYSATLYNEKEDDMQAYRILNTRVEIHGKPHLLQIRESLVSTKDLVTAIVAIQVFLISILLAGLAIINRKLSKTVWGPFYLILDRLKRYQIDRDTSIDLPRSSTAEFRDLSAAITQLVDRNREAFQNQKEFTENASHELQTPLAVCRTKLELLAQTKELTEQQAELVGSLFHGVERISRLNKNLLLLSRIENRQFLEIEEIDLLSVAYKYLDLYRSQLQEKGLQVKVTIDEHAAIKANSVLLDVLMSNLITNAVRYSLEGSTIILEGTRNYILVSNSGEPLKNPEKIFERFHRESRIEMGNGLGLSIVKKICEVKGYQLTYHYYDSMHRFKITF
jgi:signal transduction histidine kinase